MDAPSYTWVDPTSWSDGGRWIDGAPVHTLLPANATALERALALTVGRLSDLKPVDTLWNPALCPAPALPWLAWALSVDEWDSDWTEAQQREVIAASIDIHRHKGTLWSIRRALEAAGYGDAEIVERDAAYKWDGELTFDGAETFAAAGHWAEYRVVLARPITEAQAERVRAILNATAPARCHLKSLDFTATANVYDGAIYFDGTYTHGEV